MSGPRPGTGGGRAERGVRPGEASPPPERWWQGLVTVGQFLQGRYLTLVAALVLAIGATLLVGAWRAFSANREGGALAGALTARGVARLERAWWRLDFEPRPLGADGTNWLDLTDRSLCGRLRVETPGGAVAAVVCREWSGLRGLWQLTDEAELAPGAPVSWLGAAGLPELELRFSPRAAAWLKARPPVGWHLPPDAGARARRLARTEYDAVWVFLDDPLRRLAHAWSTPVAASMSVAYDPSDPTRAVPLALLAESERPDAARLVLPVGAAIGGAVFWIVGLVLLLRGVPRFVIGLAIVVTLGLVPWWGDRAARGLGTLWEPAGGFVDFFARELVKTPPRVRIERPDYVGDPADAVMTWTPATSRWAAVLAELRLEPSAASADAERVFQTLASAARAQAAVAGLALDGLPGVPE